LHRAGEILEYDCDLQLIALSNHCACGGTPRDQSHELRGARPCSCSSLARERYLKAADGPTGDRFDLLVSIRNDLRGPKTASVNLQLNALIQQISEMSKAFERSPEGIPPGLWRSDLAEAYLARNPAPPSLEEQWSPRKRHKVARLCATICASQQRESPHEQDWTEAHSLTA
jgi:magnesium chelatase family protein